MRAGAPCQILLLLAAGLVSLAAAAPPGPPDVGPGSPVYPFGAVKASSFGSGDHAFWIFEPAEPAPETAPLIVFSHGWMAIDPAAYGAWIEHLVRRGAIVLYAQYQTGPLTFPAAFTPNSVRAIKDAIVELGREGHVRPDLRRVGYVGHSAGGLLTANLAALAQSSGLPVPGAAMCVQPGISNETRGRLGIPLADLSQMPAGMLLLCVAGDRDRVVGDADARLILRRAVSLKPENKNFILVRSDEHGSPPLIADHLSPCGTSMSFGQALRPGLGGGRRLGVRRGTEGLAGVNALDTRAYWRLFDALCEAAWTGQSRAQALGDTRPQRFMGLWSDGVPVRELQITPSSRENVAEH